MNEPRPCEHCGGMTHGPLITRRERDAGREGVCSHLSGADWIALRPWLTGNLLPHVHASGS
jgi:hypothetical protein